ncbi:hypothetical protein F9U64_00070 [Gracilibacillus oryzae]|uniref:Uncharacterized protein n=1 Tax=Gracilibacillus oryzae TaxID=1672701 RepID=A0A7C8L6L5_9BACI|nr:hypothetical protein F9U64_00070 [Gracilibacillus oryzae]
MFTHSVTASVPHFCQTSRGKCTYFLPISLLYLLPIPFSSMDFDLLCNLIQVYIALYELRVPQGGDLPPTSFRFQVTLDTLVLG